MKIKNSNSETSEHEQQSGPTVDNSRRTFAKTSAMAPIIMSLASKTALGGAQYNCSASGFTSGNLSSHHFTPPTPVGCKGTQWGQNCIQNTPPGSGGCQDWSQAHNPGILPGAPCPTNIYYDTCVDKTVRSYCDNSGNVLGTYTHYTGSQGTAYDCNWTYTYFGQVYNETPAQVCSLIKTYYPSYCTTTPGSKKPVTVTGTHVPCSYTQNSPPPNDGNLLKTNCSKIRYYRDDVVTTYTSCTTSKETLCSQICPSGPQSSASSCLAGGGKSGDWTYEAITLCLNLAHGQDCTGLTQQQLCDIHSCAQSGSGSWTTPSGVTLGPSECGTFLKAVCPG